MTHYCAEEYPPLSALNDLLFCERRCFLHRVEGLWSENHHTLAGSHSHRHVDSRSDRSSPGGGSSRGLRVISHTLRVQGVADLVEYPEATPYPVEYKRGRRRNWRNDDVQLCAQAMCLEEMLGRAVPSGAIFHIQSKRRREVVFTTRLRDATHRAADRLHELLAQRKAPAPILQPKCRQCSLRSHCLPELISAPRGYVVAADSLFKAGRE